MTRTYSILFPFLIGFAVSISPGDPPFEPTSCYEIRAMEGWKVYVNRQLLGEEKEVGEQALALLRVKLFDVTRTVPPVALAKLREIPIWLEFEDEGVTCACYHPSREWLVQHGFNPEKERSVEIGDAKRFLRWTLDQPSMVLHELAHGYHHRVLGYENAEVKQAYEAAVKSGKYEKVLHYDGKTVKAYALNNPQEYFAELSEAYFGVNDFYPFVRAELKVHDPGGYALLERVWRGASHGKAVPGKGKKAHLSVPSSPGVRGEPLKREDRGRKGRAIRGSGTGAPRCP